MEIKLEFEVEHILDGLDKLLDTTEKRLRVYADLAAQKLEAKAKNSASWTDRTGDARRTIKGFAKHAKGANKIRITLQDGVYYGKYLEYCNGGKYAIIEPTIDSEAPNIIENMRGLL